MSLTFLCYRGPRDLFICLFCCCHFRFGFIPLFPIYKRHGPLIAGCFPTFRQVSLTVHRYPFIDSWVERGTVRIKCLAQEQNTMFPSRARIRNCRSGVRHDNGNSCPCIFFFITGRIGTLTMDSLSH